MTPNLGRGACDALIDAVTLAAALGGARGSLESRLARWQARRLPVTQAARIASTMLGELPEVEIASSTSPDCPNARTWRSKTVVKP